MSQTTKLLEPDHPTPPLSREITGLLSALRRRVRTYVWVEGLALALTWVGLTFWLGLAADYLPMRMGASEMPVAACALLALIAMVLAYILYRWVWRRTLVRLSGPSMALLLERRFPDFHDSLLTAVELRDRRPETWDFSQAMLAHTDRQALRHVRDVRLRRVFNFRPLARNLAGADRGRVVGCLCRGGSRGVWYLGQPAVPAVRSTLAAPRGRRDPGISARRVEGCQGIQRHDPRPRMPCGRRWCPRFARSTIARTMASGAAPT